MDKSINLALIGASGVVGQKILQLLEKKNIKINKLFPLGKSTVGQTVQFQNEDIIIGDMDSFDPTLANITIFSAGSSVTKIYARKFVESGSYVIDLSSEFRYEDDIPLIIPEINGDILDQLNEPALISVILGDLILDLLACSKVVTSVPLKFASLQNASTVGSGSKFK